MPAFLAQTLIDRAAAAADMQDDFVNEATWLSWLTVELQALTISAARAGWVLNGPQQQLIPVSSLVGDTYTLTSPSGFLAVLGVWEVDASGLTRRVQFDNFVDVFRQLSTGPITGPALRFTASARVEVGQDDLDIKLYPRPTAGQYAVIYMAMPAAVTTVSSNVLIQAGMDERIVLGMARRALLKEESDVVDISKLIGEEDAKVEELVSSRVFSAAPKVRNVDDSERGWNLQLTYPPPSAWMWL